MYLNEETTVKLLTFIIESNLSMLNLTACEEFGFILDHTFYSHFYDLLDEGFIIQEPSGSFRISPEGRKEYARLNPSAIGLMF